MRSNLLTLAAAALAAAPLAAKSHPEPAAGPLHCQVEGGTVILEWEIVFIRPIQGWLITRDGEKLDLLDPQASGYKDPGVLPGEHEYTLLAVSLEGTADPMGRCRVAVGDFGLKCGVEGRTVHLAWEPFIPPLGSVSSYLYAVYRNGVAIARLPSDQLSFDDTVPTVGDYRYQVTAAPAEIQPLVPAVPDEILGGTCAVTVDCFDLATVVEGLDVKLDWSQVPMPIPLDLLPEPWSFAVVRGGELLARTTRTSYLDTVPAPGRYTYEIWLGAGRTPDRVVAACRVDVPGAVLPPPRNLACRVLPIIVEPAAVGAAGDAAFELAEDPADDITPLPLTRILLEWENPVAYENLVIARGDMVIATLAGTESRFVDRLVGGGIFAYAVRGVVGERRSPPAECKVEVPPSEIPPPRNFTCAVDDLILRPADPDLASSGIPVPADGSFAPITVVLLTWENPIRYRGLVVLRDGVGIAKLPGDAMVHRDLNPPAGKHLYAIFGVGFDGRESPAAACEIFIGGAVPPVEALSCAVLPLGNASDQPVVGLRWENPIHYDAIHISRNRQALTRLPGDATRFEDGDVATGVYIYEVVGAVDDRRSRPAACQVEVEGPARRNLLYFSNHLLVPVPEAGEPQILPLPGSRITCLAQNAAPVQGWSFGVQSDPKFVVPEKHDLEGTATAGLNGGAGPAFLKVTLFAEGLTMAVVIEQSPPFETLPPAAAHRLINVDYAAGPSGAHGEVYPVRYSDALGDPPVQVLFVVEGFELRPLTLPGYVTIPGVRFRRGDANGDGAQDISDPTWILEWLFLGGRRPGCMQAADANGSRSINIADAIYLFSFLFGGGAPPPWPHPRCGEAPIPLGCDDPGSCD